MRATSRHGGCLKEVGPSQEYVDAVASPCRHSRRWIPAATPCSRCPSRPDSRPAERSARQLGPSPSRRADRRRCPAMLDGGAEQPHAPGEPAPARVSNATVLELRSWSRGCGAGFSGDRAIRVAVGPSEARREAHPADPRRRVSPSPSSWDVDRGPARAPTRNGLEFVRRAFAPVGGAARRSAHCLPSDWRARRDHE